MIKNKTTLYLMISMFFLQLSFPCFAMFDGTEDENIKAVGVVQKKMVTIETDQDKIDNFILGLNPSRLINLKDSVESLTSYFVSSAKVIVQDAYEIIKFTTHSPYRAIIVGTCLAYQATAVVATCSCYCKTSNPHDYDLGSWGHYYLTQTIDGNSCVDRCGGWEWFYNCYYG